MYDSISSGRDGHFERNAWMALRACAGTDPDRFYPDDEDIAGIAEAKLICAMCPVQSDCLEHALAQREKLGIWGGLTSRERLRILRRRRRQAA
jgi:WhiB family redox-sensing transcriptional regulator